MIVDAERPPMILGVDLTIDELLVIANRLDGAAESFPIVLGVTPDNILIDELREAVWADVADKLTEKNILDPTGIVIPAVAQMIEILTRPDRTLECRWWREQHGVLVRFAIARRGNEHVIMGRTEDKIVIQRVANVGLAAMVESVIDVLPPADMGAVTGPAAALAAAETAGDLISFGCDSRSANTLLTANKKRTEWVHILATETRSGGHVHRVDTIAAGILDSHVGRVVSLPKTVGRELHATFLPGTRDNIARALRELTGFLPSGSWDENGQ